MPAKPDLARLLAPRSIAIIGASNTAGAPGALALGLLVDRGFDGAIYPVNPRSAEVKGRRAYASLAELPAVPDLAIVAVAAERAVSAVAECATAHVPFALILSAGFAEVGPAGAKLQDELLAAARTGGVRLVGPNTLGFFNVPGNVPAGFGLGRPGLSLPPPGRIAILSQSGGMGLALLNRAAAAGLGVSCFVATGNEADLTLLDFLDHLVDDPGTDLCVLFAETLRQPDRFPEIADRARRAGKPILIAKIGRFEPGRRAARQHTGADTGDDAANEAMFAAAGCVRMDDPDDLFDLALFLTHRRLPAGRRVAIITPTGGAGAWLAEALAAEGLSVPVASPALQERLRPLLVAFASAANPVDLTPAGNTRDAYAGVAEVVAASGEYDAVAIVLPLLVEADAVGEQSILAAIAERCPLPLIGYSHWVPVPSLAARRGRLPVAFTTSPRRAAIVLAAAVRYAELAERR